MFDVVETTVADVHAAYRDGSLTATQLVQIYLDRISRYDGEINAFITLNADAVATARALDAEYARTGVLRPLHGIPIVVKDNFDTFDMPTTAGSAALAGLVPPDDARQVAQLREAGAVILGKANMAEWALSPDITLSSIDGLTRNPYDLSRASAGSSGGTGAAVAANLALIGMGTDTGNSIRGPSGHMALVGIRSTMGLTSRDGIVPLYQRNDVGGPMARTVEDAARTLNVTAGYDPADPITARSEGRVPVSYLDSLDPDGLEGARIGVNRWFLGPDSTHPDIVSLMEEAVAELREAGAEIVDPFDIEGLEGIDSTWCDGFKSDLEAYFATRGPDFPYKTLDDILATGKYAVYIEESLRSAAASTEDMCLDVYNCPRNIEFRERVLAAMDANELDAFVYPTWSYPARLIDDLNSPAGDNSQFVAPRTGLPAIQIPIGFTREGLPAGMTFIGRLFDESTLIRLTYSYEQATHKRKTPKGFE